MTGRRAGIAALLLGTGVIAFAALSPWAPRARATGNYVLLGFTNYTLVNSYGGPALEVPTGSPVTETGTLTNGSDGADTAATPKLIVSAAASDFASATVPGWSPCLSGGGALTCSDPSTLAPGSSTTVQAVLKAIGAPGDGAVVSFTVTPAGGLVNSDSSSATAADSPVIINASTYAGAAPAGAFSPKLTTGGAFSPDATVSSGTYTFTPSGGGTPMPAMIVPPNAFPSTQPLLAVYTADGALWSNSASSRGQTYIDGYAASWGRPGDASFDAAAPITLSVSDPGVEAGDRVYTVASTGIGSQVGTASSGGWTASFTGDPGFVVLRGTPVTSTSTTSTTSTSTTSSSTTTVGSSTTATTTPTSTSASTPTTTTTTTATQVALLEIASVSARRLRDGRLALEARTRNDGHARSPLTWTEFYLRAESGHHRLQRLARVRVGELRAGHGATEHATAAIPSKLGTGRWRVMACSDATHRVSRTSVCRYANLVVAVSSRHRRRVVTISHSTPPAPPRMALLAPFTPGSGGRTAPILLLLIGFTLLTGGTASLGLRHRRPAAGPSPS